MPLAGCEQSEHSTNPESSSAQGLVRHIDDGCIEVRLLHALRKTGYSALSQIDVSVLGDLIILEGRVASYHLKQLAQEAVRKALGDAIVKNMLEVTG